MKTIAESLITAMIKNSWGKKLGIIVTAGDLLPEGFGLKSYNGLDRTYHGQLSNAQIKELSLHTDVKAIKLVVADTIWEDGID